MTPDAFLQQIAWLRVQPSSVEEGDTFGGGNNGVDDDYIVGITVVQEVWDPGPTHD